MIRFEIELADHAVKIAGERGQIFESLDGFLGALRILGGELRDLPCRLRNLCGCLA